MVVVPGALALAMPSHVGKICSHMNLWRKKGLINNRIGHIVLGKESPSGGLHPGPMSKFDCVFVAVGENRKEALQVVRVISVLWGKLAEKHRSRPVLFKGCMSSANR